LDSCFLSLTRVTTKVASESGSVEMDIASRLLDLQ
jgi:hypothetical protein